jgi:hypothetical protein
LTRPTSPGEFYNPAAPEWDKLAYAARVHHERRAQGAGAGFGRFSGLPPEVPTMHELGITQYLDNQRIPYVKHYNLARDYPDYGHRELEADIYLPSKGIIIEVSPGWHVGPKAYAYIHNPAASPAGRKNIARVIRNDKTKARLARDHGLRLVTLDPGMTLNQFGREVNEKLIPALREAGYNPRPWHVESAARANALRRAARRMNA